MDSFPGGYVSRSFFLKVGSQMFFSCTKVLEIDLSWPLEAMIAR